MNNSLKEKPQIRGLNNSLKTNASLNLIDRNINKMTMKVRELIIP